MPDLELVAGGIPELAAHVAGERLRITGGQLNSSINDRATATLVVNFAHLAPVDYSGPLVITAGPEGEPRFTGHVVTAETDTGGTTTIAAESGRQLVESRVGIVRTRGVSGSETFHLLASLGGYADEQLSIEGLDALPLEAMAVEMPVAGLKVTSPFKLLGVEFRPWDASTALAEPLATEGGWGAPTAVARVYVVGRSMLSAERTAQDRIAVAVDALLTTAIYGLSRDTSDHELRFQRDRLLARPEVVPVVHTQAVATQRRWIHEPTGSTTPQDLDLEDHYRQWAAVLSIAPSVSATSAMRALRDAADSSRPVDDRCHHLWSALEYYAANAAPPRVVSKGGLKRARRALKALELEPGERKRLMALLDGANQPPLMARLRHQAIEDGVPTSDAEWSHLAKLRAARNRTVHGSTGTATTEDDLRWGVSIAARMVLFGWSGEA